MRDLFEKYVPFIAVAVFLGAIGVAYIGPRATYQILCAGADSCIREWVGALSGWAAAIGALYTINAMLLIQRQNVDIQLHPSMTIAKKVRQKCINNKRKIQNLSERFSSEGPMLIELTKAELSDLRKLVRGFGEDDVDRFEEIEYISPTYLRSLRIALVKAQKITEKSIMSPTRLIPRKGIVVDTDYNTVRKAVMRAAEHNTRLREASERFLSRWESRGLDDPTEE
ncbi:hypothetical protein GR238_15530 [Rhizobium leguminosarum]|uniref:hypothetical protein n=1 Tax=Rhizobium ruizarguesonis TaxID=2081791 RepID=UPI0013B8E2BA|nr:hypothetical protein [Rhizobium ruizarguesonis]NEJ06827.1 hypothetical protein [Rhizobium ruizarguesonis]